MRQPGALAHRQHGAGTEREGTMVRLFGFSGLVRGRNAGAVDIMGIMGARMMLILLFVLAAACKPAPEVAEVIVVDGDTLRIDGERIRLHGIDAPEAGQTCARPDGGTWNCGASATAMPGPTAGIRPIILPQRRRRAPPAGASGGRRPKHHGTTGRGGAGNRQGNRPRLR